VLNNDRWCGQVCSMHYRKVEPVVDVALGMDVRG